MNWTPISEGMPPANKPILLKQQRDGYEPFVIVGIYAEKHTIVACDFEFGEYSEQHDEVFCPEGFYERMMNWDEYRYIRISEYEPVIAWMEIPGGEA